MAGPSLSRVQQQAAPAAGAHKTTIHKPQTANTNPQTTNLHALPNRHTQAFKLAALADPKKLAEVLRGDRKMNIVTSLKRMHFKNLLLSVVCVARARARAREVGALTRAAAGTSTTCTAASVLATQPLAAG